MKKNVFFFFYLFKGYYYILDLQLQIYNLHKKHLLTEGSKFREAQEKIIINNMRYPPLDKPLSRQ